MRMVLVHGISQEGKSAKVIHDDWMKVLRGTFANHGFPDPSAKLSRTEAAYYGDDLEKLSDGWIEGQTIALGVENAPDDFDEFAAEAFEEMALRIGATRKQIESVETSVTVAQAAGIHKKWLKAIALAVQKISPFKGTLALRLLRQAHAYIRNEKVHTAVNNLVRPVFEDDEPMIVVSHSLGTIVAYSLLREFAKNGRPRKVALFITLGSPLGIDSVRKGFSKPRNRPADVRRWFNGSDPEDFVALRAELTAADFGSGIENFPDFENGDENAHSIVGYLSDSRVAVAIVDALATKS